MAQDLEQIRPGLSLWQAYDRGAKADLFSTAIRASDGLFLIDPILLHDLALARLVEQEPIAGVIVTNTNHHRAAPDYVIQFSAPLFASRENTIAAPSFVPVDDGDRIGAELEVTFIDGAAPQEIALYHPADGGTLIIGDALINFDPYGFALLPDKYCTNAKQMRISLRKLLRFTCERMLFAHGTPILSGADSRLRRLLDADL
jgi:metallo-beta-lactamase superfamily protein